MRPFFHGIAYVIGSLGTILIVFGGWRFMRAPVMAAQRKSVPAAVQAGPGARAAGAPDLASLRDAGDRDGSTSYQRGLTDFYRISAGLTVLAGVILLIITIVAA